MGGFLSNRNLLCKGYNDDADYRSAAKKGSSQSFAQNFWQDLANTHKELKYEMIRVSGDDPEVDVILATVTVAMQRASRV